MNNIQRSRFLTEAAGESLAEANFSLGRGFWGLVVRRCQEAVELELSSVLALAGIHFPKNHDQAPMVIKVLRANRLESATQEKRIELISADLSRKRGPALHQEEGYDEEVAKKAVEDTTWMMTESEKLKKKMRRLYKE